ncbi:MAG: DUF4229 domain-containing protein [Actinomycetota bacterium]|nr:DUF4229 domain-containing protein [Actinomycetota bacterium]
MKFGPTFKSTLIYSLARLALLAIFLGAGYLVGLRGFLLIVVGFVVSAVASLFLLDSLRDDVSSGVFTAKQKINKCIDAATAAEDAWIEAQLRKQESDTEDQPK